MSSCPLSSLRIPLVAPELDLSIVLDGTSDKHPCQHDENEPAHRHLLDLTRRGHPKNERTNERTTCIELSHDAFFPSHSTIQTSPVSETSSSPKALTWYRIVRGSEIEEAEISPPGSGREEIDADGCVANVACCCVAAVFFASW